MELKLLTQTEGLGLGANFGVEDSGHQMWLDTDLDLPLPSQSISTGPTPSVFPPHVSSRLHLWKEATTTSHVGLL